MFCQKLCETKFVDLIETNNFVFLRFFRISHNIVKKLNFGFSIVHDENVKIVFKVFFCIFVGNLVI